LVCGSLREWEFLGAFIAHFVSDVVNLSQKWPFVLNESRPIGKSKRHAQCRFLTSSPPSLSPPTTTVTILEIKINAILDRDVWGLRHPSGLSIHLAYRLAKKATSAISRYSSQESNPISRNSSKRSIWNSVFICCHLEEIIRMTSFFIEI
jgi:hypothetical protein